MKALSAVRHAPYRIPAPYVDCSQAAALQGCVLLLLDVPHILTLALVLWETSSHLDKASTTICPTKGSFQLTSQPPSSFLAGWKEELWVPTFYFLGYCEFSFPHWVNSCLSSGPWAAPPPGSWSCFFKVQYLRLPSSPWAQKVSSFHSSYVPQQLGQNLMCTIISRQYLCVNTS